MTPFPDSTAGQCTHAESHRHIIEFMSLGMRTLSLVLGKQHGPTGSGRRLSPIAQLDSVVHAESMVLGKQHEPVDSEGRLSPIAHPGDRPINGAPRKTEGAVTGAFNLSTTTTQKRQTTGQIYITEMIISTKSRSVILWQLQQQTTERHERLSEQ